jgi:hypothetical protein
MRLCCFHATQLIFLSYTTLFGFLDFVHVFAAAAGVQMKKTMVFPSSS